MSEFLCLFIEILQQTNRVACFNTIYFVISSRMSLASSRQSLTGSRQSLSGSRQSLAGSRSHLASPVVEKQESGAESASQIPKRASFVEV